MQFTDLLSDDHRIIERLLNSLDDAASRLQAGVAVRPALFIEAADFIKSFADGHHHRKEEEHLFPAMKQAGFPRFGGPIAVMFAEHDEGRRYAAGLSSAAERLAAGDATAIYDVVENAQGYVALQREHIVREENVLFVWARRALSPETLDELLHLFDRIERQDATREKWLAAVEALEREVTATTAPRAPQKRSSVEVAVASIPPYRHTTSGSRPVETSSSRLEEWLYLRKTQV